MKFGDWNVLWGKVDVTKVHTTIVHYAKLAELTSYDYANLCKACSEAGYLIKKLMKLDSPEYEQFLTSLKKDMHNDVMELWERVSDGYRGWQASHSYWKYSEYESINDRSRIELPVDYWGNNYKIFVTYKVHKTKAMSDASMAAEIVVVNVDRLPAFNEHGVYYANMQDYAEKDFDLVLSAVQQPEVCFTYDNLGRVKGTDRLSIIADQYKQATEKDMDISADSMYVRFAVDEKHGYIHVVVLHILRDGSTVLHGSAHKILRTNTCQTASTTLHDALVKLPADPVSIGFPLHLGGSLLEDILVQLRIAEEDVKAGESVYKIYTVNGDKTQGFEDSCDKNYLIMLTRKDTVTINVTITLLDNRQAICLSQLF